MTATPGDMPSTDVRLHITPLDRELLDVVIPASLRPSARNISLHTIETFPEKRFGFVDLPAIEADKLRRKLNGTVFKSTKFHIQVARPEHRPEPAPPAAEAERPRGKRRAMAADDAAPDAPKRRKRDPGVLEGFTLTDRKVKRGWTESVDSKRKHKKAKENSSREKEKEKRKRPRSRYTDKDECLLKVKLPPNALGNVPRDAAAKKSKSRDVTVHEFATTTQFPSFLKHTVPDSMAKTAVEFIDGKGWVDQDGVVVEAAKTTGSAAKPKSEAPLKVRVSPADDSSSSSGTSSEEDETDESEQEDPVQDEPERLSAGDESPATSHKASKAAEFTTPLSAIKASSSRPPSSSSSKSLTIKIPRQSTTATTLHPLEALYKRAPKAPTSAVATPTQPEPFSFFGDNGGDDDEGDDEQTEKTTRPGGPHMPMTPFTRQDFEQRGMRSAAPTPDTAHPSRRRSFWPTADGDDDEHDHVDDEGEDGEPAPNEAQPEQDRTDFQAWFWNNRSELNRSWMTRRKTAAKEKRHRENKTRASKAV